MYIDTLSDGTKRVKPGEERVRKAKCCEPNTTNGGSCCSSEKKASGCCASEGTDFGCCVPVQEQVGDGVDLSSMAAELGDVDLNEWVGK